MAIIAPTHAIAGMDPLAEHPLACWTCGYICNRDHTPSVHHYASPTCADNKVVLCKWCHRGGQSVSLMRRHGWDYQGHTRAH